MNKTVLRLLVATQIFSLFFLMILPYLIRVLSGLWGKTLYGLLVITGVGLALALRYAFISLD